MIMHRSKLDLLRYNSATSYQVQHAPSVLAGRFLLGQQFIMARYAPGRTFGDRLAWMEEREYAAAGGGYSKKWRPVFTSRCIEQWEAVNGVTPAPFRIYSGQQPGETWLEMRNRDVARTAAGRDAYRTRPWRLERRCTNCWKDGDGKVEYDLNRRQFSEAARIPGAVVVTNPTTGSRRLEGVTIETVAQELDWASARQ